MRHTSQSDMRAGTVTIADTFMDLDRRRCAFGGRSRTGRPQMIHTTKRQPTYRNHKLRGAMGSCCSSCAAHMETGPPIGAPHSHTHGCGGCGGGSLSRKLGDVTCDQYNNCYDSDTGVLMPGPNAPIQQAASPFASLLMTGPNPTAAQIAAGMPSATSTASNWLSQNATTLSALAAVAAILAFAVGRR
jgi:hypothetical protein